MSEEALDWLPASLLDHAAAYVSKAVFDGDRAARAELFDARSRQAIAAVRDAGAEGMHGQCPLCEASVRFFSPARSEAMPDFREGLVCERCRTPARARAGLAMVRVLCPDRGARIYITEQASASYLWLRSRYPRTTGSEFERSWHGRLRLSRHLWRSRRYALVRFEDVTRLRLASASQHAVVSFDVIEHVADDGAALREFARVTEPGGWLVLTAPFAGGDRGVQRTRIAYDGHVEHLLPPEYHGDPLGGGVLCHRHYGWDLLEALRDAGYRHAAMAMPWWPEAGLFDGLATFIAQR